MRHGLTFIALSLSLTACHSSKAPDDSSAVTGVAVAPLLGQLDVTYGTAGYAEFLGGSSAQTPIATAVQSDGKLLVLGTLSQRPTLSRLNVDGSLDASFGINGSEAIDCTQLGGTCVPINVHVTSFGQILLVGAITQRGNPAALVLMRLTSTGALDAGFGNQGFLAYTTFAPYTSGGVIASMVINDQLIVSGPMIVNSTLVAAALRFNFDGSIDTTFGSSGSIVANQSAIATTTRAIYDPAANLLYAIGYGFAGYTSSGSPVYNLVVSRHGIDGSFDQGYGSNGAVTYQNLLQAATTPADAQLVSGELTMLLNSFNGYATLIRLNPSGGFENAFGLNGVTSFAFADSNQQFTPAGFLVQADLSLIVLGNSAATTANAPSKYVLGRLTSYGYLDLSFGTNGYLRGTDRDSTVMSEMAMGLNGDLLVTGSTRVAAPAAGQAANMSVVMAIN